MLSQNPVRDLHSHSSCQLTQSKRLKIQNESNLRSKTKVHVLRLTNNSIMSDDNQSNQKSLSELTKPDSPQGIVEKYLSTKDLKELPTEQISLSSHTLRTTLTILRNYLWVTMYQKDEVLGPKTKRNLSIIRYAAEFLNNLIENTLVVNKIDDGKVTVKKSQTDLLKLVEEVISKYSSRAVESGVTLVLSASLKEAPAMIDAQKTTSILDRLVENALKFTPAQGKVSFKVSESDDESYFEVSVSDSGPGIDKIAQKELFKKFGRIEESYANLESDDGSGLGLYIASKYAQLQGGKIVVKSDAGAGATFVVSLPKI